jgi:hypothetical protein
MSAFIKKTEYPNGSYTETHTVVTSLCWITAPNPFGKTWTMKVDNGIHNQSTGNPDAQGIHRRGRKWYLHYEPKVGYSWR